MCVRVNTTVYCVVSPLVTVGIQLTVDSYNLIPVLQKTRLCRAVLLVKGKEYCVLCKYDLTKYPCISYDRADKCSS